MLVFALQGTIGSLPSHGDIMRDVTNLSEGATGLRGIAGTTAGDVAAELEKARKQEADAGEVREPPQTHQTFTFGDIL